MLKESSKDETTPFIKGEVATDEVVRKMIEFATIAAVPITPKMSLEEYIQTSYEIRNELDRFAARWFDKLHVVNYKKALGLLIAEIDRYDTLNKYYQQKGEEYFKYNLVVGLCEELGGGVPEDWNSIKELLWEAFMPARW